MFYFGAMETVLVVLLSVIAVLIFTQLLLNVMLPRGFGKTLEESLRKSEDRLRKRLDNFRPERAGSAANGRNRRAYETADDIIEAIEGGENVDNLIVDSRRSPSKSNIFGSSDFEDDE